MGLRVVRQLYEAKIFMGHSQVLGTRRAACCGTVVESELNVVRAWVDCHLSLPSSFDTRTFAFLKLFLCICCMAQRPVWAPDYARQVQRKEGERYMRAAIVLCVC